MVFNTSNTDKSNENLSEVSESLTSDTIDKIQQIANEQNNKNEIQFENQEHQQFSDVVQDLLNSVIEEQMSSEQQVQSTLNQANTNLSDISRLDNIYNSVQQLKQATQLGISNLQTNMQQHRQIIEDMQRQCHKQQVSVDMQVIQALQQAVSAMTQAQNSMFQSQSVDKIFDSIITCQDYLKQIEQQANPYNTSS